MADDTQARALAVVDAEIERAEDFTGFVDETWVSQGELDEANKHLRFLRALRKAIERHGPRATGFRYSDSDPIGYECASCRVVYPCPELTEITKELNI